MPKKMEYIVTEHKGYFSQDYASNMVEVQAIISQRLRDAKEEGRKSVNITIKMKEVNQ